MDEHVEETNSETAQSEGHATVDEALNFCLYVYKKAKSKGLTCNKK